jgi:trehalose/maltose hydrolase-like predicted phosphorylase
MPDHWKGLDFRFTFRGVSCFVSIQGAQVKISGQNMGEEQIKVHLCGKLITLSEGQEVSLKFK